MDFLKDLFGDKPLTFDEFTKALEANKEIKLANLASGQYVDKAKFDSKDKEHQESAALIAELKKGNAGNESLQKKITEYETKLAELQTENQQIKLDAAIKVALLEAKAVDVDYLTFKLKEKGEIKLGDDGKPKGMDEAITGLKTQFPAQFSTESKKKVEENKLPENQDKKAVGITPEQFSKMGYQDRLKLHQENPEAYKALTSTQTTKNETKEVNENG
jgi:hypothetical protein